jgi:hypothetical protein
LNLRHVDGVKVVEGVLERVLERVVEDERGEDGVVEVVERGVEGVV